MVVKAIKARAPMLVVNRGVMVFRSVCSSQVVRQHRCSSACQCRLAVDSTHPNSAIHQTDAKFKVFVEDSPSFFPPSRQTA